jgi:hypothetical protein
VNKNSATHGADKQGIQELSFHFFRIIHQDFGINKREGLKVDQEIHDRLKNWKYQAI